MIPLCTIPSISARAESSSTTNTRGFTAPWWHFPPGAAGRSIAAATSVVAGWGGAHPRGAPPHHAAAEPHGGTYVVKVYNPQTGGVFGFWRAQTILGADPPAPP